MPFRVLARVLALSMVLSPVAIVTIDGPVPAGAQAAPAVCGPATPPVQFSGTATPDDVGTYRELPFEVLAGTTRVEATYDWTDAAIPLPSGLNGNVFDLGLWDGDGGGIGNAAAFRGWSGSRAGRQGDQPPVFVQQDVAQRGYQPAVITPGVWNADLGIAAIDPLGTSDWEVTVTCSAPAVGAPFVPDPVDPTTVADAAPGWYRGDFHMHGFHSNLRAPDWQAMVDEARAVGLDFLPITDYVTGQHWDELGLIQRANPDLLIIPGREIITYFGHANAIGETRSVFDYRHGHDGVSLADIEAKTVADGALFQVNHPTFFPGPVFANFCRGCEFRLGGVIDWSNVDTLEVLTGPAQVSPTEVGLPDVGGLSIVNPFELTAINLWHQRLNAGDKITAVSGSDSKGVEPEARRRWGTSTTAVYSQSLSRPDLFAAIRAGHAYVQTLGATASPRIEFSGTTADGQSGILGDTLYADTATLTITVRGGVGQVLLPSVDGLPLGVPVPITSDPFTHTLTANRLPTSGPLGTFWRFDIVDVTESALLTVIANPIFLADPATRPAEPSIPAMPGGPNAPAVPGDIAVPGGAGTLPATGGGSPWPALAASVLALAVLAGRRNTTKTRTIRPH